MTEIINQDIYDPVKVTYQTDEVAEFRDNVLDHIHNLPQKIELFFYEVRTSEKIKSLCEKFQLAETQSMFLTCIIRDVAVAITYYGDIVKVIQDRLDVPEQKARQIAQAITELYDFALEDIKKLQVATFPDRIKQNMEKSEGNVLNLRETP